MILHFDGIFYILILLYIAVAKIRKAGRQVLVEFVKQ